MSRARDTQRQRVYNTEKVLGPLSERIESVPDIQAWLDKVLAKAPLLARYGKWTARWKVRVKDGRRRSDACGDSDGIRLPVWSRTQYIILHEAAHTLTERKFGGYDRVSWHGPEFCGIYLDLVRFGMGAEAHAALKASFKAGRVKAKVDRKTRFVVKKVVSVVVQPAPVVKKAARPLDRRQKECAQARRVLYALVRTLGSRLSIDRSDSYFEMTPCPQFPKGFTTYHYDWIETLRRVQKCVADPSLMDEDGSGYSE